MQNHHTFHRRFRLLLQPLSQRRHVVTIPGASVTQLTDMVFLNWDEGDILVCYT